MTGVAAGAPAVGIGVVLRNPDDAVRRARRAEELGFDAVACGEHIAFRVPTPSCFVSLGIAAGATERVRLISTVIPLPLYPPVLAAKLAASLDVASGGRFEMGVGLGGDYPPEFEACGVPLTERGARCDEALEVMGLLWAGGPVSFGGRFSRFDGVAVDPKPVQRPRLPLWVAGRKEPALRRAARHAAGWMPYLCSPEHIRAGARRLTDLRQATSGAGAGRIGLFVSVTCHREAAMARRWAAERLSRQYGRSFDDRLDALAVAGDPETCRHRLAEYLEAGCTDLFFAPGCPDDQLDYQEELLAHEVLPALRSLSAGDEADR